MRVKEVAERLKHFGVAPGTRIGVDVGASAEYVFAVLGVLTAGCAWVPLEPDWPAERKREVHRLAGISVLLCQDLQGVLTQRKIAGDVSIAHANAWPPGRSPAYVVLTSGSTGKAKVILGNHAGVTAFLDWESATLTGQLDVRTLLLAPTTFDASFRDLFLPLLHGGTVCIPPPGERSNPAALVHFIQQESVTVLHTVPSVGRLLAREASRRRMTLRSVRLVALAGEPLYTADARLLRSAFGDEAQLVGLYGASEATMVQAFCRIDQAAASDHADKVLPIGQPIGKSRIYLDKCDSTGLGEVVIESPFAANGYLSADSEGFEWVPDPVHGAVGRFRTGDVGQREGDQIYLHGRMDDGVKLGGRWVYPSQITAAARAFLPAHDFETVALSHRTDSQQLVCCAAPELQEPDQGALQQHLASLPCGQGFAIRIAQFAALPRLLNGKADRAQLRAALGGTVSFDTPAPRDTLRSDLEAILGRPVDPSHSLAAMGAGSLQAMELLARIHERFGLRFSIAQLWEAPSFSDIESQLDASRLKVGSPVPNTSPARRRAVTAFQADMLQLLDHEAASRAYSQALVYDLRGHGGRQDVERAVQAVFSRIPELNQRFCLENGAWHVVREQNTLWAPPCRWYRIDDAAQVESALRETWSDPWDIQKGSPARAAIIERPGIGFIVALAFFHVLGDIRLANAVRRVLCEELLDDHSNTAWPAPPSQQAAQEDPDPRRAFWHSYLRAWPSPLHLSSRPRPALRTFDGFVQRITHYPPSVEQMRAEAADSQVTLFSWLFATFSRTLHQYTAAKRFSIGIPYVDPGGPAASLSMLPLQLDFSSEGCRQPDVAMAAHRMLSALIGHALDFRDLVDLADQPSSLSRSPLFDVTFTFVPHAYNHLVDRAGPTWQLKSLPWSPPAAKYDLSCAIFEDSQGGLCVELEANSHILRPEDLARLLKYWHDCVQSQTGESTVQASV